MKLRGKETERKIVRKLHLFIIEEFTTGEMKKIQIRVKMKEGKSVCFLVERISHLTEEKLSRFSSTQNWPMCQSLFLCFRFVFNLLTHKMFFSAGTERNEIKKVTHIQNGDVKIEPRNGSASLFGRCIYHFENVLKH